jgi:hypothetical protein
MAREMSGDEISVLSNYSLNLRQLLSNARQRRSSRRSDPGKPSIATTPISELPPPPPVKPVQIDPPDDVEQPGGGDADEAVTVLGEDVSTAVIDRSSSETADAEVAAGPGSERDGTEAALEPTEAGPAAELEPEGDGGAVEQMPAPTGAVPAEGFGPDEPSDAEVLEAEAAAEPLPRASLVTIDLQALAEDVSVALEGDDAKAVLRLLRREIIAVSESVYRLDEQIATVAWDIVTEGDWYEEHESELDLKPIGEFYALIDEFKASRGRGDDPKILRSFLSDRGFSKLLLTLREVFLRNGV